MRPNLLILAAALVATVTPALAASECGKEIQAIERRMHSAGGSAVTGQPMSPDAKAQASNAAGHAAPPSNASEKPSPQKMKDAQGLIDTAKQKDQAGDKKGCETAMMEATKMMGALP